MSRPPKSRNGRLIVLRQSEDLEAALEMCAADDCPLPEALRALAKEELEGIDIEGLSTGHPVIADYGWLGTVSIATGDDAGRIGVRFGWLGNGVTAQLVPFRDLLVLLALHPGWPPGLHTAVEVKGWLSLGFQFSAESGTNSARCRQTVLLAPGWRGWTSRPAPYIARRLENLVEHGINAEPVRDRALQRQVHLGDSEEDKRLIANWRGIHEF